MVHEFYLEGKLHSVYKCTQFLWFKFNTLKSLTISELLILTNFLCYQGEDSHLKYSQTYIKFSSFFSLWKSTMKEFGNFIWANCSVFVPMKSFPYIWFSSCLSQWFQVKVISIISNIWVFVTFKKTNMWKIHNIQCSVAESTFSLLLWKPQLE